MVDVPVQARRREREANPSFHQRRDAMTRANAHKVVDPMLPRKASKLQAVRDRTVNRLRWVRRKS